MRTPFRIVLFSLLLPFYGVSSPQQEYIDAQKLDLTPAKWIWYPSKRTLQNTFILFRKEVELAKKPVEAEGWLYADSRYLLFVNGHRVQWGPAPCDPRWQEADPVDLAPYLRQGNNVIAIQVLYYGAGDGTSPMGKPGLLFNLDIDGQKVLSDGSWKCCIARSWPPGHYKREFLRCLQEEFDARIFPYGWDAVEFKENGEWMEAMELAGGADKPSVSTHYREYMWGVNKIDATDAYLRKRSIPLMKDSMVQVKRLTENMYIEWRVNPDIYFEMVPPDSYKAVKKPCATEAGNGVWRVKPDSGKGVILTFELEEQMVGFPCFTMTAPEGTVVEVMIQESHRVGGPELLNTKQNAWSRFVCREGRNSFEAFDYESLRWIQLHIRNLEQEITVENVGVRRRIYPWNHLPQIELSDPLVQQVMMANINNLYNSAQEIVVDGMGRERQQYSGDGTHQFHPIFQAFGNTELPRRVVTTFSQGLMKEGYFADSWPAFDRLARVMQRQIDLTKWGPLIDHGVGFGFDNYYYYEYTGDTRPLYETLPRYLKFFDFLKSLKNPDGLLEVVDLGTPAVWMDHQAYKNQQHKQLSFNLYTAAMCRHALAPWCKVMGEKERAREAEEFGQELEKACVARYWSADRGVFVCNLPWEKEEQETRYCDRSLATAILFDQCPGGESSKCAGILADAPDNMGLSYPCNAVWRHWALIKARRMDVLLQDIRTRWAGMNSVKENNTIQEFWSAAYDSEAQWSHSAVAPLVTLYQGIGGVRPLQAGWGKVEIAPQFGDLTDFAFDIQSVKGSIRLKLKTIDGIKHFTVALPEEIEAELVLDKRVKTDLSLQSAGPDGLCHYILPKGTKAVVALPQ